MLTKNQTYTAEIVDYTSTDDPTPAWVTDARNQIRNLMG